jgi:prepilin-type N-terminal cleavage/methylation domain-containing protein
VTGPQPQLRGHRRSGFTLVELIVAALIGVLIAGATATAMSQLFRARGSSAAHQQAFSRADGAAARIAFDLTNALRRTDPLQQKVAVINGGSPGAERDEVLMLMKSLRPLRGIEGEPEGDEFESQYRIMPAADGQDALWHRIDMAHDEYIDAGGIASPVVGGMVALSIQANDGTDQWFDDWDSDSDGLPHAIRISVTAKSDDGRAVASAVRIVALDRVPIPLPTPTADTTNTNNTNTNNNSNSAPKTNGFTSSTQTNPTGTTRSGGNTNSGGNTSSGGNRGSGSTGSGGSGSSGSGATRPPSGSTKGGS